MRHRSLLCSAGTILFAVGALVATPSASAQPIGAYPGGPNEEVIVTAPRLPDFREYGSGPRSLDLPPERVSLSRAVRFDDLDLTSWQGVSELRRRVRHTAREVCGELRDAYPFQQLTTSPRCYREALENGLLRADAAVRDAQLAAVYAMGYDPSW